MPGQPFERPSCLHAAQQTPDAAPYALAANLRATVFYPQLPRSQGLVAGFAPANESNVCPVSGVTAIDRCYPVSWVSALQKCARAAQPTRIPRTLGSR